MLVLMLLLLHTNATHYAFLVASNEEGTALSAQGVLCSCDSRDDRNKALLLIKTLPHTGSSTVSIMVKFTL